jgi:hypothetical protein
MEGDKKGRCDASLSLGVTIGSAAKGRTARDCPSIGATTTSTTRPWLAHAAASAHV